VPLYSAPFFRRGITVIISLILDPLTTLTVATRKREQKSCTTTREKIAFRKNAHDILRITSPKNESVLKYFHAKESLLIFNRAAGKIFADNNAAFVITKIITLELNVTKKDNNYN